MKYWQLQTWIKNNTVYTNMPDPPLLGNKMSHTTEAHTHAPPNLLPPSSLG